MLEGCTPFPAEFVERYVRAGIWRRETIPEAIVKTALERSDSTALADSTRSLTYSQLIAESGTDRGAAVSQRHRAQRPRRRPTPQLRRLRDVYDRVPGAWRDSGHGAAGLSQSRAGISGAVLGRQSNRDCTRASWIRSRRAGARAQGSAAGSEIHLFDGAG